MSEQVTRKQRRADNNLRRSRAREQRWATERYSVPYRTDRPTVSLGIAWFVVAGACIVTSQWLVGLLAAVVAGVAGLQTGHAWAAHAPSDRRVAAGTAAFVALSGLGGTFGLGLAVTISTVGMLVYSFVGVQHRVRVSDDAQLDRRSRPATRTDLAADFAGILLRSSVPAGVAAGSLVALTGRGIGAALAVLLLVSAYEVGDYLVGTGSDNAFEGPVAGVAVLALVGASLVLAQPDPIDSGPKAVVFALLTAVCCPLGQVLGSAILPRGSAWAPGLRRLDSLLIAGPIWLILL